MNHVLMEDRLARGPDGLAGGTAYHALTYGWLMSGLARAVTGKGMRELFRTELAGAAGHRRLAPGPAAGRRADAAGADHRAAERLAESGVQRVAPMIAALPVSGGFGSMYFPGMKAAVQGDIPLLDTEMPAANGVATARGAGANVRRDRQRRRVDGTQFLSPEVVARLSGRRSLHPDGGLLMPLSFHLGYHGLPFGVVPGFGHVGLGGSLGWADPAAAWRSASCTIDC